MKEQRQSGHTVTRFTAHLVWVTKYRYPVLNGDIETTNIENTSARISWPKKRYWGRHFWAIGYGGWSTGNITEEMVQRVSGAS